MTRLVDLDPRWLLRDGRRIGVIFICPTDRSWRQTCFFEPTSLRDQDTAVYAALRDEDEGWQPCREDFAWKATGDTFDTLSIMPSIDGSAGGLWHGFITNGEIA